MLSGMDIHYQVGQNIGGACRLARFINQKQNTMSKKESLFEYHLVIR